MFFIYTDSSNQERSIAFDATENEAFDNEYEATENPVEEGAPTTDHIRPKLRVYTADVVISNKPVEVPDSNMEGVTAEVRPIEIGGGRSANVLQFSAPINRARLVYEELERVQAAAALCTVVSRMKTFENMALLSVGVVRNATVGNDLYAKVVFREVRIASVETVPEPDLPTARPRSSRGNQTATEDENAERPNASLWSRLSGMGTRAR